MRELAGSFGPVFWYASRALGLVAYVALTLELLLGLSASTGVLARRIGRGRLIELHRWLSALMLGAVGAHALVLLGDQTVRLSIVELLVPFTTSYRPFAVGLGVLGAYVMLVVHASFALRRWIGPRVWRRVHYLTFPLFAAATLHGLLAGSDARTWALRSVYVIATALVGAMTLHRILLVVLAPPARLASPGSARTGRPTSPPTPRSSPRDGGTSAST